MGDLCFSLHQWFLPRPVGLLDKGVTRVRSLTVIHPNLYRTGKTVYTPRIAKIGKAAKLLKHGTEVGIGLNVASTPLEIKEACSMGREELCRRAHYLEGSKLAGGLLLGLAEGELGAYAAPVGCFAELSAPTLGLAALGCGIIAGGALAYGGGALSEIAGESFGETVYEWIP